MTRRQLLLLVAGEGALWCGLGALLGLVLGLVISVVLVDVVNPQSFHWSMELALPWERLGALVGAVAAGRRHRRDGSRARCGQPADGAGGEGGLVMRRRTVLGRGLASGASAWAGTGLLDVAASAPTIAKLGAVAGPAGLAGVLGLAPDSAEAATPARTGSTTGAPASAMQRRVLVFPRDHGSHPAQAIEWWYLTGWLATGDGEPAWGFQLTFFRSRGPASAQHPSHFAASQVLMAHAALTELGDTRSGAGTSTAGRLSHDQRIARVGMGLADASETDTAVLLNVAGRPWRLSRNAGAVGSHYRASFDLALGREAGAERVGLRLDLNASQPPLLQGEAGWSRKGPEPDQASFYVSEPQLQVSGELLRGGKTIAVRGRAWLDHEWSDQILPPQAQGWDWLGINLFDGSALTLFRLRRKAGAGTSGNALWAGGSWRGATGPSRSFAPGEATFEPLRRWTSPTSSASYPVQWRLTTPLGTWLLRALADAQELDARASTSTVYWEGLSELLDAASGRRVGLGYPRDDRLRRAPGAVGHRRTVGAGHATATTTKNHHLGRSGTLGRRCDSAARPHLAVGMANSAPLAMLAGQRCITLFCLV